MRTAVVLDLDAFPFRRLRQLGRTADSRSGHRPEGSVARGELSIYDGGDLEGAAVTVGRLAGSDGIEKRKEVKYFARDMYETYTHWSGLYYNPKTTLTRRISAVFLLLTKDELDARVRCLEGFHRGSP